MYLLIAIIIVLISLISSDYIYRNNKYFDKKYKVDFEEKESIKGINLYYSLKKGLFELSSYMGLIVFVLMYIYVDMPKYVEISKYEEVKYMYLLFVGVLFMLSLFRTLFILNYKLILKDNLLYFKNGVDEIEIDLKTIEKVNLFSFHISLKIENKIFTRFIPIGIKNSYILYRVLKEAEEYNKLYRIKNKN